MDIRSLNRSLPTQATPKGRELAETMLRGPRLNGDLKEAALEQLSTVPEPWLERLKDENMAFVALGYGEDLSQTDLLWSYTPESVRAESRMAGELVAQAVEQFEAEMAEELKDVDEFQAVMAEREKPFLLSEKLSQKLQSHGIASAMKVSRDAIPLLHLEQEFGIESPREGGDPEVQALFRETLQDLNGILLEDLDSAELTDETMLQPKNGVVLVPFGQYGGRMLSPVSKESYAQISGAEMDQHYGAHYWEPRIIALDDDVVSLPSKKTGFHSVLLHETGHGIDYIAEQMPDLEHRQTVDSLFSQAMEQEKMGERPFLTPRARDNVREYFAEGVEAYLTQETGESADFYKPENSSSELQERDPALYGYLEQLFQK